MLRDANRLKQAALLLRLFHWEQKTLRCDLWPGGAYPLFPVAESAAFAVMWRWAACPCTGPGEQQPGPGVRPRADLQVGVALKDMGNPVRGHPSGCDRPAGRSSSPWPWLQKYFPSARIWIMLVGLSSRHRQGRGIKIIEVIALSVYKCHTEMGQQFLNRWRALLLLSVCRFHL